MSFAFIAGSIPCFLCRGAGEISDEQAGWVALGAKFRQMRQEQDLSTREMAKKLGLPVVQLSDMEFGRTDPSPLFPPSPNSPETA